jgi:hypothetical protein
MSNVRRLPAISLSLLAVVGLALAACGSDDDDEATTNTTTSAGTVGGDDAVVELHEYAYEVSGKLRPGGTLRVRNTGDEFHMMGLAKLKAGKTFEDAKAALFSEDEADDGEVMDRAGMPGHFIGPGSEAGITVPGLEPGTYFMACFINVEGEETPHFVKGMMGQIEVVGDKAEAPEADATYVASKGKAVTGPATLTAGRHVLKIEAGADAGDLEPGLYKLNPGATVEQFGQAAKLLDEGFPEDAASKLPGRVVIGMFDFVDTPAVYLDVDLEPGTYVIGSDDSDDDDNPLVPVEMIQITVT